MVAATDECAATSSHWPPANNSLSGFRCQPSSAANEIAGVLTEAAAAALGFPVGIPVGPGAGDNAGAALGIGATQAELLISLGTSGVATAFSDAPTNDPTGEVAGFADATGVYLPLACMLNCTRVVGSIAEMFGRRSSARWIRPANRAGRRRAPALSLPRLASGRRTCPMQPA